MRWLLPALLLVALPAMAADWSLAPAEVRPGGVTRLSWLGEAEQVRVRFNGEEIPLTRHGDSWSTLLGVDLEASAGDQPLTLTVEGRDGETVYHGLHLSIRRPPARPRPAERLRLPKQFVTPTEPTILERLARERAMLKELYAQRGAEPARLTFVAPLAGPVVSPFGRGRLLNGKRSSLHAGVDFGGTPGTPVPAAGPGRVAYAGDLYLTGQTVILDHGAGLFTIYAHLRHIACREGEMLGQGAILGELGSTGRATGPHLHWGAKLRGARIDPFALVALFSGEKR